MRRPGIALLVLTAMLAGGAARGAVPPNVPGNIQAAIALEKKALKEYDQGKLDAAEKDLKQSRALLQGTLGGIPTGPYAAARADVKQAIEKDSAALTNLRRPAERLFVRLRINTAIIRKEGALAAFGYEKQIATAPPAPPRPSQPPRITSFEASLVPPNTTYMVTAADPDTLPDRLTYTWTNSNTCGRFRGTGPNAVWEHGNDTNCSHETPFHPGEITVTVADGAGSSCTVKYPNGSLGVAPYDPGEDCKNGPPKPVLVLDLDSANDFYDDVEGALKLEKAPVDAKRLKNAAKLLKAIQVDLANALSASKGGRFFDKVMKILRDLHAAEELDREAVAEANADRFESARAKAEDARDRKQRALAALDSIIEDLED